MNRIIKILPVFIIVLISVSVFSSFDASASAWFPDTQEHWAVQQINRLAAIGLVKGNGAGDFNPDSEITRAEFLTLVNRLFGSTIMANISQFKDIEPGMWYYSEIAKAYQMGTTVGNGGGLIQPLVPVTREQAALIIARVLCLPPGNNSALFAFSDREQIASYSRDAVAAMTGNGYMSGSDGKFLPAQNLTRAESAAILNNIIGDLYSVNGVYSGNCDGNLLLTVPGIRVRNAVIKGDVIIGDGVGRGDIFFENCTINGRLVVRGGGENSIYLTNTEVQSDTYVQNNNNDVHIDLSGGSSVKCVMANSGIMLSGDGVRSVFIGEDMKPGTSVDLSGCDYESLDVMAPETNISLSDGSIENVHFGLQSSNSTLNITSDADVRHLGIYAPDVNVSGRGTISHCDIAASGTEVSISPGNYTIADNTTARIGGTTRSGRNINVTGSSVARNGAMVDEGYSAAVSQNKDWSTVTVEQTTQTELEVSRQGGNRLAYWIRIFLPAPAGVTGSYADAVSYGKDGEYVTKTNYYCTTQDGKLGIEYYVPVVRTSEDLTGAIDDELYIEWDSSRRERIYLRSKSIKLRELRSSQEIELINQFYNAEFHTSDAVKFIGTEAVRRLLLTENTLGLDVGAFPALPEYNRRLISAQLNSGRDAFTTKDTIQSNIYSAVFGKGALYAINRSMTIEQLKTIVENKIYAAEIGIDISNSSKYMRLSYIGRLSIAKEVYSKRGNDFTSIDTVRKIVEETTDKVWIAENDLLVSINGAKSAADLQKIFENTTSAAMLGIVTDADPYKKMTTQAKTAVAGDVFAGRRFAGLDTVKEWFEKSLTKYSESSASFAGDVASLAFDKTTATVAVGQTVKFVPTATLTDKTTTNQVEVTWSVDKPNLAEIAEDGTIKALGAGSVKIEAVLKNDLTKKASATVTISAPVYPTKITLPVPELDVAVGYSGEIKPTVTPTNYNVPIIWSSTDESVVSVDQNGMIKAHKTGMAVIKAQSLANAYAECKVWVYSLSDGLTISETSMTVEPGVIVGGEYIGETYKLTAVISPKNNPAVITWTSADQTIATVSEDGTVRGFKQGMTTITAAATINGVKYTASCIVTVSEEAMRVILDKTKLDMYKNELRKLTATVTGEPAISGVLWSVQPSGIISVDENGNISVISAGTAVVTATSKADSNKTAVCEVTVLDDNVTVKLEISKDKTHTDWEEIKGDGTELITNWVGKGYIKVTFTPVPTGIVEIEWKTDSPDALEVEGDYETGMGEDALFKPITAIGVKSGSMYAGLSFKITGLFLSPEYSVGIEAMGPGEGEGTGIIVGLKREIATVVEGTALTLPIENTPELPVLWTSSDTSVAIVNQNGVVSGVKTGKVSISANVAGNITECVVEVKPKPKYSVSSLSMNRKTASIAQDKTLKLTAAIKPANATIKTLYWYSQDEKIAKVDQTGLITGVSPGKTVIYAVSDDGKKTTSCTVTITPKVSGVTLKQSEVSVKRTKTVTLSAVIEPANASNKTVTWKSSDTKIATVDKNGRVKGVKAGTAIITVTTNDGGFTASCTVTVTN